MNSGINEVSWNLDDLGSHIRSVSGKRDELQSQREFLENLRTTVDEAWRGIAGTAYNEVMSIDINTYNSIIRELDSLLDDLRKVTDQCYSPCEDRIREYVRSLRNL